MRRSRVREVVGACAEGEVGRVGTGGVLDIPGPTMRDRLRHIAEVDDSLVRFILFEPRGSARAGRQCAVAYLPAPSPPEL